MELKVWEWISKKYELHDATGPLIGKFTVEERIDNVIISTFWNPYQELEPDRKVKEFDTYSAALAYTYEMMLDFAMENGLTYKNSEIKEYG